MRRKQTGAGRWRSEDERERRERMTRGKRKEKGEQVTEGKPRVSESERDG